MGPNECWQSTLPQPYPAPALLYLALTVASTPLRPERWLREGRAGMARPGLRSRLSGTIRKGVRPMTWPATVAIGAASTAVPVPRHCWVGCIFGQNWTERNNNRSVYIVVKVKRRRERRRTRRWSSEHDV